MEVRKIPRTGRPKVDEPRKKSVCIRLTDAEYDAVSQYAAERNWTITKVLVEGFESLQGKEEPAMAEPLNNLPESDSE